MIELKPCPYCGGKMRLLRKDPVKIGIAMDCTECHIRVAVPWAYDAEHGIPAFNKRASGWIPCSERLPNPYCTEWRVGVTTNGKAIAFKECHAYESDTGLWKVPTYLAHASEITHWMPLPEPPEMNGGCNENHTNDNPELMGGTS